MGEVQHVYSLSPMQQGMLFHSLYSHKTPPYLTQISLCLQGELDASAFRRTWTMLVERHPVLRTSFLWEGLQQPVQVVQSLVPLPLEELDYRGFAPAEQEKLFAAFLESDYRRPLDLGNAPVMRLTLIRTGSHEHRLVWTHHHLLLDGWSVFRVLSEFFSVYSDFSRGLEPSLTNVRGYGDYIGWLQSQDMAAAEAFWREELRDFMAPTPLPVDDAGPDARTGELDQEIWIDAGLSQQLQTIARKHHVTLNTLVQGTWAILLGIYSGESDVVFGATISGRPSDLTGVEEMVGLFINTLPVRARIRLEESVIGLLLQIQESQAESRQYQYAALPDIQKWSAVPRGTALFESVLVFENYPVDQSATKSPSGLRVTGGNSRVRMEVPLALMVVVTQKGIGLRMAYLSPMFGPEKVTGMLERLAFLLKQIAEAPERSVGSLELLAPAERKRILIDWNATSRAYPADLCLHWHFEEMAAREPQRCAVEFAAPEPGGPALSYGELNEHANQLAHHLRQAGVRTDEPVAVCMERCLEMVVALFGILKAGGAYLPVDPAYPEERAAFMLRDSGARYVLCTRDSRHKTANFDITSVPLDSEWSLITRQSRENPSRNSSPANLAYVIYTSGSTGMPKGAMLSHSGICNRLLWMQEAYGLSASDAVLQKTPFTFDVSVWEFFWPLITGARLVVAPPEKHRDSAYLTSLMQARGITTAHFVPSMLQLMLQEGRLHQCGTLKRVICSGEALPLELQERFFDAVPGVELHNLYGPTEASVDVTFWRCSRQMPYRTVPIGRPIANTQIYILDRNQRPVPAGVAGELHIGGINLARGYLAWPELTAEKFIPNPFGHGGERLYRTGDLARWMPEGVIEFLGRDDTQVKIRGFRIELGEIEERLRSHPQVMEAVVVAREDSSRQKRLVAYVSPNGGAALSAGNLRLFLQQHLPEYMVPPVFCMLPAMPLSSNGKINRRALPEPSTERPELIEPFVTPATREESVLAEIWAQVLGVEKVGVKDNFFNLGGDSIRSVQVLGFAREQGLDFSLDQLFRHQTIRKLAAVLTHRAADGAEAGRAPFSMISEEDRRRLPEGIEDAYPIAALQAGMLFHGEFSPESAIYINITTLRLQARFDGEAMKAAIGHIIQRHAALRTSFSLSGYDQPLQLIHREAPVPLETDDLRGMPAEEQARTVEKWFSNEKQHKFDYTQPPLLRFQVHQLSEDAFQFSWTEHHSILDGWSISIMLTELFQHYFYLIGEEQEPVDTARRDGMRDFVALELAALSSDTNLAFWKRKLAGSRPTQLPRLNREQEREDAVHRVGLIGVPVPDETFTGLQNLAQALGVPLKTVLLAAHLRVMSFVTGEADITTGVSFSGRPETSDTDRTMGVFLNILPFRMQMGGGSWSDLIRGVFEAEVETLPNRWYPMAKLQTAMGGEMLYETVFNYTHFRVYRDMLETGAMKLLENRFYIETNFAFTAHFSLNMFSNRLQIFLDYDAGKLGERQVRDIGDYYLRALQSMVREPSANLAAQTLLSPDERSRLLDELNHSRRDFEGYAAIHRLFEKQVRALPERTAVASDAGEISYRELNARANRIARRLLQLGVRPESRVAILMNSSPDVVAAMLGAWKAGGAYLPLDPAYPGERIRFVLDDAEVSALITCGPLMAKAQGAPCPVLALDSENLDSYSAEDLDVETNPAGLAYIIYTSGSTGRPKGVSVEHRGLFNLIRWHQDAFSVSKNDAATQIAGLAFDASVWEMWPYLACGASLHIPDEDTRMDLLLLQGWLKKKRITVCFLPTPLAERALQIEWEQETRLRTLLTGGERLHFYPPAGLPFTVINNYGPTENTVVATSEALPAGLPGLPPIGKPIANNRVYVLDAQMQPVPAGTAGELYIGGGSLARGYLNRPQLTAEKFLPDPFSGEPGARLYRTGDLVRWNPESELEYVGRVDEQIKIRGFRIEAGEIENVLNTHPSVSEAVVSVQEEASGAKRLVAYLVQKDALERGDNGQDEQAHTEQISFWEKLFNDAYSQSAGVNDPTFNIIGWNSSYTGAPLPPEEMREWRDETVERIQALRPAEVLEIGCGTGLLLFPLTASTTMRRYCATDFSHVALEYVSRNLKRLGPRSCEIDLSCRQADDFTGIAPDSADCVVINSVVQYFPSIDYLTRVLEGAVQAIRPGGSLFIGDVRSLPLLEAFHASVVLHQAPDALSKAQMRQRIQQQAMKEEELAIDPLFFHALSQKLPKISHVTVLPKSGRGDNELTRFRYDVILRIQAEDANLAGISWVNWKTQSGLDDVRGLLEQRQPEAIGLAVIPNARLASTLELLKSMAEPDAGETVRDVKERVQRVRSGGIMPCEIMELARELQYHADLSWSRAGEDGSFDVLLRRKGSAWDFTEKAIALPRSPLRFRRWKDYGNNPLQKKFLRQLVPGIKSYLEEQLPEYMIPAAFVVLERLPLTPNGKIDKKALLPPESPADVARDAYAPPRNWQEETLATIWAEVLGVEQVGIHDNFFELGGDSILSIQIVARANKAGLKLSTRQLFSCPTIAQIGLEGALPADEPEHEQEIVTGPVPFTPIQCWFLEQNWSNPHYFNQAMMFEASPAIAPHVFERAFRELAAHHDSLRLRLSRNDQGWLQLNAGLEALPDFRTVDLSALSPQEFKSAIEAEAVKTQGSLNLMSGPLLAVRYLLGPQGERPRLLAVCHHMAIDGVSWRILLEDLQTVCRQLQADAAIELPLKTTSFQAWARGLQQYAQSSEVCDQAAYWSSILQQGEGIEPDFPAGENTVESEETISRMLTREETEALLRDVPERYSTQINEVLLAALGYTFKNAAGIDSLLVDMEGHGREEVLEGMDLSRTVGWFTSLFPVCLDLSSVQSATDALKTAKEQVRRIPARGLGYGLLRYLCEDEACRAKQAGVRRPRVNFNYLGQFDQTLERARVLRPAGESPGPVNSPDGLRPYLLTVHGLVVHSQLKMTWTYSRNMHCAGTIENLAKTYMATLRQLVDDACAEEGVMYTAVDFPDLNLTQGEVESMLEELNLSQDGER
jgi:amino acid adenylation domain-containing protein/non-ribosomal peptide synthase protein (TIGR01720 family)